MARDDEHFRLRIPDDLKAKVEAAAASNKRSMTAEINARVQASFENENESDTRIDEISAKLDRILHIIDGPARSSESEQ